MLFILTEPIQELEIKRKAETSALTTNDLLLDIREVLNQFSGPEIGSRELLERLLNLPEGDWHSANHGRAISSKWLAQKLRPYGIVAQRRNTGKVYMMADFDETFRRFLPTQTT